MPSKSHLTKVNSIKSDVSGKSRSDIYSVRKVEERSFTLTGNKNPVVVTDVTFVPIDAHMSDDKVIKRYFSDSPIDYIIEGQEYDLRKLAAEDDPSATLKEIFIELDSHGSFQSVRNLNNAIVDDDGKTGVHDDSPEPEPISFEMFEWPKAIYFLLTDGLSRDQWSRLYEICLWLQRAYDVQYTLDEELQYVGPEQEDEFFRPVRILQKEIPLRSLGEPVEPYLAALKLGQLWEQYRSRYSIKKLFEYDFGTHGYLDVGRKTQGRDHRRRNKRKDEAMKRFVQQTYPSGIKDVQMTKIARRMIDAMKDTEPPTYLEVFTASGKIPAESSIRNRLSTMIKGDGFD